MPVQSSGGHRLHMVLPPSCPLTADVRVADNSQSPPPGCAAESDATGLSGNNDLVAAEEMDCVLAVKPPQLEASHVAHDGEGTWYIGYLG
jgi:hypothetical protein